MWFFYNNLYKSKLQKKSCEFFFELVKDNIQILDEDDIKLLEKDILLTELENALKQMKDGKSPGMDGITVEFVKHFWNDTTSSI